MAPLCHSYFSPMKVLLLLSLVLSLFTSLLVSAYSQIQPHNTHFLVGTSRKLLESQFDDDYPPPPPIKKKTSNSSLSPKTQTKSTSNASPSPKTQTKSTSNLTKLIKPTSNSSKLIKPTSNSTKLIKPTSNSTKLIKPTSNSTKLTKPTSNSTKLIKPTSNSTKLIKPTSNSTKLTKPTSNSTKLIKPTSDSTSKSSNSAKPSSNPTKVSSDLKKSSTPKNKATKPKLPKTPKPNWIEEDDDEYDLVSEFRDLPNKFQETLLPDLKTISTTSKVYLNRANKEFTKGFIKPLVGKKYASTVASIVSCAFILIPLILVSLIFNQIKAYFSLQKLIIFIQVYLSIYFTILCISSIVTGIEPLRFFYAASQSTYACMQVLQTLGYVLYLLLLLMYFVLVFSTDTGLGLKVLSLAQLVVGLAVGLHYYVTVFHRMVLHQSPKASWRVHGIYATCFLVICLLARAERRKKAYLEDGGEEGKKS